MQSVRQRAINSLQKVRSPLRAKAERRADGIVKSARMRLLEVAQAAQDDRRINCYRKSKDGD